MNIRIENQNARFKITEIELKTLLNGDTLSAELNSMMVVVIDPSGEGENMRVEHIIDNGLAQLTLIISKQKLTDLAGMGKSRDGISVEQNGLLISLQVDVRKNIREKK